MLVVRLGFLAAELLLTALLGSLPGLKTAGCDPPPTAGDVAPELEDDEEPKELKKDDARDAAEDVEDVGDAIDCGDCCCCCCCC